MRANDAASGRRLVETYYDAVDDGDYDRLASLLAPDFVHDRPDRTLSGRDAFVSFMREDRPERDTRHEVTATYRAVDGAGRGGGKEGSAGGPTRSGSPDGDADGWVARGRLVGGDGDVRFAFVDLFDVGGGGTSEGRIRRIETFVRGDG